MIYSILFFILAVQVSLGRADCVIDPLVHPDSPLVIPTGKETFIYPKVGETTVNIGTGQKVDLICPGSVLVVSGKQTTEIVQATCKANLQFSILGQNTLFTQVWCAKDSITSSRLTGKICESRGLDSEVGFSLGDGRFLRVIQICYDLSEQSPLYTQYTMTQAIGNSAKGVLRPEFTQDTGFYPVGTSDVNLLYTRQNHRKSINNLLGLPASSTKYIQDGDLFFLSRGHLAAKGDFYYPAQQNATFRYINAAPQWQSFNGRNWESVEKSIRDYADKVGVDLQIWTGLYDVATLSHEKTGKAVPLYLYTDTNTQALPVPALYWKVVYNPVTKRGVALVGLNNPYRTKVECQVLCADVSSSVPWVKWNREDIAQGYSYACEIQDLRRKITYLPNLSVTGLLV